MQLQRILQDFCSFCSQVLTNEWRCMLLFVLWVPSVLPFRTYLFLFLYLCLFKGFAILIQSLEMSVSLGLKILVLCDCSEQRRGALGEAVLGIFHHDLWKQRLHSTMGWLRGETTRQAEERKPRGWALVVLKFSSTFLLSSRDIYYSFKV